MSMAQRANLTDEDMVSAAAFIFPHCSKQRCSQRSGEKYFQKGLPVNVFGQNVLKLSVFGQKLPREFYPNNCHHKFGPV